MSCIEVRHYVTSSGRDPVAEWLESMRDPRARAAILLRIGRLERGLLGDCKFVGDGVSELRIGIGPGYRLYFARQGDRLVLLLCGGDKRGQRGDIARAKRYWSEFQQGSRPQ